MYYPASDKARSAWSSYTENMECIPISTEHIRSIYSVNFTTVRNACEGISSPRSTDPRYHQCGQLPPVTAVSDIRFKDQMTTGEQASERVKPGHQLPQPKRKTKKAINRVRAEATRRVLGEKSWRQPWPFDILHDYWLGFPLARPGHQTRLNSALRITQLSWGEIVAFLGKSDSLSNWGGSAGLIPRYFILLIAHCRGCRCRIF
jgi:hypothetical protein